jgi:hypothetical protein
MKVIWQKFGTNGKAVVQVDQASRVVDISGLPESPTDEMLVERFNGAAPRGLTIGTIASLTETPPHVKSRREKMIAIGQQSVASRDRVFPKFPHVPASRKNQAYDGILAALMRGKITLEDLIPVRNLKTGEYEDMHIWELLDEVAEMFLLQVRLRLQDRQHREQVNQIFKDATKTDEEKAAAIDALELPEFLDVDEGSTSQKLVSRRINGNPGGKAG